MEASPVFEAWVDEEKDKAPKKRLSPSGSVSFLLLFFRISFLYYQALQDLGRNCCELFKSLRSLRVYIKTTNDISKLNKSTVCFINCQNYQKFVEI